MVLEKTQDSWTARKSNQSILKEIRNFLIFLIFLKEYSLKGPMLKLKL